MIASLEIFKEPVKHGHVSEHLLRGRRVLKFFLDKIKRELVTYDLDETCELCRVFEHLQCVFPRPPLLIGSLIHKFSSLSVALRVGGRVLYLCPDALGGARAEGMSTGRHMHVPIRFRSGETCLLQIYHNG